jgi:3-oxoadipate enol-lactonase
MCGPATRYDRQHPGVDVTAVKRDQRELELDVPMGHRVHLPGRGTTYVREVPGPSDDAPTVVLVHTLIATAGLNWFQAFGPLGERYRVLAPDLRGHGRGIHSRRRFAIEDCADDIAAMLDLLGAGPSIVVGYSMGGPVAEVLWRRHRRHVAAMALVATGAEFDPLGRARLIGSLSADLGVAISRSAGVLGIVPNVIAERFISPASGVRAQTLRKWARREMQRHSTRAMVDGAIALARFRSADWIGGVDVPVTVVVTERDTVVPPRAQRALAALIPGADVVAVDGDQRACLDPGFGEVMRTVCDGLADRVAAPDSGPASPRGRRAESPARRSARPRREAGR